MAIKYIGNCTKSKIVVLTDSLFSLRCLEGGSHKICPIIVRHILFCLNPLRAKELAFCWIPGHANIEGYIVADATAKLHSSYQLNHVASSSYGSNVLRDAHAGRT